MNFKDFEELIKSGTDEITLTEDVILEYAEEELFEEGIAIENDLIIRGNGHLISFRNYKSPYVLNVESGLFLENCSLIDIVVIAKNSNLNFKDCHFKRGDMEWKYSIYMEHNSSLDLKNCILLGINSSDSNLNATDSDMGVITVKNGELNLKKSKMITIDNNHAQINLDECDFIGNNILAPIYNKKGIVNVNNCNFEYLKSYFSKRKDDDKYIHNEEQGYIYSYDMTDPFILNEQGSVEINDSTFKNNDSKIYQDGGAIYNDSGSILLKNCLFEDNYCDLRGGAIYNDGSLTAKSCIFNNNNSKFGGKSIHNLGNLVIDSCEFSSDEKNIILNEKGHITVKNSKLESHHQILAKEDVHMSNEDNEYNIMHFKDSSYLQELLDSELEEIKLDYSILGGGFKLERDNLIIDGCGNIIDANNEDRIFEVSGDNITLKNLTFKNGLKHRGDGGAIFNNGKTLNIENCIFENNRGTYYDGGGAIYNKKGNMNIKDSIFKDNISPHDRRGGAIFNNEGNVNIANSIFLNNLAADAGGAIYNIGTFNIKSCEFIKNKVKYIGESMLDFIGGGIYNKKGKVSVENTNFEGNEGYGEAIYNDDIADIHNSSFKGDDEEYMIINKGQLSLKNISLDANNIIYNNSLLSIPDGEKNRYLNNIENMGVFFKIIENDMKLEDKGFAHLDSLINSDSEEITLDHDIILAIDEENNYKNGIKIKNKKLIIHGNGHYIDAKGKSSIFDIADGEILIENVICKNVLSNKYAIESLKSDIKIDNCIFENNYSGIIHSKESYIELNNSKFFDNFSLNGAIAHSTNSFLKISDCDFNHNRSPNGGMLYTEASKLVLYNSRFSNCYNIFSSYNSDYNVILSTFEKNENNLFTGGGPYNKIRFNECNFDNNHSNMWGIENNLGFISLIKCNFRFNSYYLIWARNLLLSNCFIDSDSYIETRRLIINIGEYEKIKEIIKTNEIINPQDIFLDTSKKEHLLSEDMILDDITIGKDFILDGNGHEIKGLSNNEICSESENIVFKNIVFSESIKIVNKKSLKIENCRFTDTDIKIENYGKLLLKNCSFEYGGFSLHNHEIIINKANLTLENCSFKKEHKILNTGEVTLINDDETEVVLMSEIIEINNYLEPCKSRTNSSFRNLFE